ncbi:MAG: hypothetical protein H8D39_03570 [Candidatus Atribacteria bacterium]|nr:hypothetical protein [Candidatus Atribacteria bacterium]
MCCEECPKYEKCEENNHLKDDCCSKCPDYCDCVGADDREKDSSRDSFRDRDTEDSF